MDGCDCINSFIFSTSSSVTSEELDWINARLLDLKSFIERNAQIFSAQSAPQQIADASQVTPSFGANWLTNSKAKCMFCLNQVGGMQPSPHHQQDAFLRERQSLMFLQQLLGHTIQVLGLWKIVCEHQVLMTPSIKKTSILSFNKLENSLNLANYISYS